MTSRQLPPPDAAVLYENAACALLLTEADGTIVRANATFCRWTGYDAGELVRGRSKLQDLFSVGARIFHQTHWAPLLRIQGAVSEVKLDLLCSDGRVLPILMNAVRREHVSGTVFHELSMLAAPDRDMYERELVQARRTADQLLASEQAARLRLALAEARLRLALDSAGLMVWELDAATGERRYEDKVALLLGHAAPAPVTHGVLAAMIDPADRPREAQQFDVALASAHPDYACTYRINGVDGRQRVVRSTGRGLSDGNGAAQVFVGVLQDVSEAVGLRAAAEDRALFAEQMIGIVSHDLRNPLAAIRMSVLLLGRAELDAAKRRSVLGRVTMSVDRADRLIRDLLDFTASRIGSGLPVMRAPIDLKSVVTAAVEELAAAFHGRTRLLHEHVDENDARIVVTADADRLVQAIGNLVANAVSYGESGAPVCVTSCIGADGNVSISVHNAGAPIDPGRMAGLFDPMTRFDANDAEQHRHSVGLGLYIVRQIALAHSGEVRVKSSAGQGTDFTLTFPGQVEKNG